jgi:hypothetical protein
MRETASGCSNLEGRSLERAKVVEACAQRGPEAFDAQGAWKRFEELMT